VSDPNGEGVTTFYDVVTGKPVFKAP